MTQPLSDREIVIILAALSRHGEETLHDKAIPWPERQVQGKEIEALADKLSHEWHSRRKVKI